MFKKNSIEFPIIFVKKGMGEGQRRGVVRELLRGDHP